MSLTYFELISATGSIIASITLKRLVFKMDTLMPNKVGLLDETSTAYLNYISLRDEAWVVFKMIDNQ